MKRTKRGEWNATRAAYVGSNPRHRRLENIAAYPNYYENRYWHWPVDRTFKYDIREAREEFIRGRMSAHVYHGLVCLFEEQLFRHASQSAMKSAEVMAIGGWIRSKDWRERFERSLRRLGRGVGYQGWCEEYVDRYGWQLLAEWNRQAREAEEEWRRREAIAEQKRHLREGAETLRLLRRHLRSPGQSLLLESRPERTSPI